jgi:thioesterase domain-containing protein
MFGHSAECEALSRRLPHEIPFYGLSVRGDEAYWQGCESLGDMARGFLEALLVTVPHGPYIVVGYSFGGRLAFEMARQMLARGLDVRHLVIIDTDIELGPRSLLDRAMRDIPSIIANLPRALRQQYVGSPGRSLRRICRKIKRSLTRMFRSESSRNPLDHLAAQMGLDDAEALDGDCLPELYKERCEISVRASQDYRPETYRGNALVIRCKIRPLIHIGAADLGWGRWISGQITVANVPGHHGSTYTVAGLDNIAREIQALRARI